MYLERKKFEMNDLTNIVALKKIIQVIRVKTTLNKKNSKVASEYMLTRSLTVCLNNVTMSL